jgi:hypothetical protein
VNPNPNSVIWPGRPRGASASVSGCITTKLAGSRMLRTSASAAEDTARHTGGRFGLTPPPSRRPATRTAEASSIVHASTTSAAGP